MSTINIDLAADTILNVMIGQQDENEVREVVFDFSGWYTTYGSGTISLAIQRPKDEWPYEGTLTVDSTNHKATWEISETDTAYAGIGQIQLSYKVGDAKKKSVVYRFTCHKSLGALGSVVTPVQIQTFIDEVEEALQTMDGKLDDMDDQIADVKADLSDNIGQRLTDMDGIVVPEMELGTIGMSSSSIVFNNATNIIRTPQNGGIPVSVGDVIHLTDYTNAKFRCCILKDSDGKYAYTSAWLNADYRVANAGVLYLLVTRADGAEITNVSSLSTLVRVDKHSGNINDISNQVMMLNNHESIIENNSFASALFANGDTSDGVLLPTTRVYRVSTISSITLDYDIYINVNVGFRVALYEYLSGAWVRRGGSSSWVTNFSIVKGTKFAFCIAKTTEDTSTTANVEEFVSNLIVYSNLTNKILSNIESNIESSKDAIQAYMSHFYNSNEAESYAFFTDPHLMGQAGEFDEGAFYNYIGTLEAVVKQTSVAYVVSGGDWLNREDTKAQASVKLGYVDGKMRAMFPDRYYPIVGNHDFNYIGYEDGSRLPEADWVSNSAMRNFWFHDHEQCYYKFKHMTAQNYVLNTRTDYDGTNTYDKTMLDWFAEQLIEDDAPHATIMFHIMHLSTLATAIPKRVVAVGKIIEAFNGHTTCTLTNATEGYDKTYDFTGTTGKIDYVIVGHTHADFTETFGGVPAIGCVNFTKDSTPSFDLVFADYTNNKVYTTRIGSGESREFNI